ncbi:MAG TPA: c-type cytochrome [Bdellovibrionota bacterium]|nr:c-type cytochrome [Bdellovibrionota bacterium]
MNGRIPMAVFTVVLGASFMLGGFARSEEENWLPSEPLKGRVVFEQKHCPQCHSIGGAKGGVGPDLAEAGTYFHGSFLQLSSILWNHIPDMLVEYKTRNLSWPSFSEDEVGYLISYLYYLRYLGSPGDVANGQRLLQTKGCVACHAVGKQKKAGDAPPLDQLKKYVSPLYLVQAVWNHGPRMQRMIEQKGIKRPTFDGQEISDMSAYIRNVSRWNTEEKVYLSPGDPKNGERVFESKGCVKCHSEQRGRKRAPSLEKSSLNESAAGIAALMWNHADVMMSSMKEEKISWPTFEGREMPDLVAYLFFLDFLEPPGNAAKGKELFGQKQCSYCHSIHGAGGTIGPDLAVVGSLSSTRSILRMMVNHAENMSEAVLGAGKAWPVLGGDEMNNIFAYLKSVERKEKKK